MSKWNVYAIITGSKYLGEFEAETQEEAQDKAAESPDAYVSICHQCAKDIDDPQISEFQAEPA